ncbi:hypothetical protein EYF80_040720 [Liparis tanakae]|uniref:Uncharacterized protein n=1 Tax=Liparis tanakae TaxID=230148 RepID=A0A4Z2G7S6_9TELE|nr:hypothetical protein EYF80_040720 [Liparis tanakae]
MLWGLEGVMGDGRDERGPKLLKSFHEAELLTAPGGRAGKESRVLHTSWRFNFADVTTSCLV